MRNPKWHRDEIILALDLYLDPYRGPIDSKSTNVIALSEILNQLPIFSDKPDATKFRNPNGVSLKLSNFLAIDPTHSGKGMQSYSKLDKEVFEEYSKDRRKLRQIANQIKSLVTNEIVVSKLQEIEEDENIEFDSVQEGQVLYRYHKYRERNKKINTAKKNLVLKTTGKLLCEVCSFDFEAKYGEIGKGFIECHHIKPLYENENVTETRLEDLALVCSNCHRMLHRKISYLSIDDLKKMLTQ